MDSTEIQLNMGRLYPYKGMFPKTAKNTFLADGVKLIGDVILGEKVSIWYNAVLRADVNYIRVGEMSNIQDLSMLHVTNGKFPLNIGRAVTIGHSVKLHGCTIEDFCLVGIGSVVLDGAVVETNSIVAAGAVVTPGFRVPKGTMVAGVPARVVRNLRDEEIIDFKASAERYWNYSVETMNSIKLTV